MRTATGLWVVAAAVALAACSSCSSSSNNGGGPGDGGAGDAAGEAGVTAEAACNHLATALCSQLNSCAPFVFQTVYGDTMTCITRASLGCMPALGANGSQATPAQLDACAGALGSETCDQAADNAQPQECNIPGTLAAGAACGSNAQCQSGYCKISQGVCGTCSARAAAGAACKIDVDCQAGLVCNGSTCVMPGAAGAACSVMQPSCMRTLACIGGQCATPLQLGATCSALTDCDGSKGLICDLMATPKACVQTQTAAAGAPCGISGSTATACTGSATCDVTSGTTGTCHTPAGDNELCGPGVGCLSPATCVSGKCLLPSPSSCH